MTELDFIEDKELRLTLENSTEFIYALYEKSKDDAQTELFLEETYRIIILYVTAAIEAVLMYFYKLRVDKIEYVEYKFVYPLPPEFNHNKKHNLPLVVAVQEKKEKSDHQIGLHDLVVFFKTKKLILNQTADEILELNELRNTFHFSKPRSKKCDIRNVEAALSLLVYVLERAPHSLKKKK